MNNKKNALRIVNIVTSVLLALLTIGLGIAFMIQTYRVNGNYKPKVINIAITQMLPIIIIWAVCFVASFFFGTYDVPFKKIKPLYKKVSKKTYLIIQIVYGFIILMCAAFTIGYMAQTKHFTDDFTSSILSFVYYLLPFAAIALVATVVKMIFVIQEKPVDKDKISGKATIIIQISVIFVAVAFIITGLVLRQEQNVLTKAIKICLECIGIG